MATFAPSSTPSPPPSIRTPPTPKHGFSDPWEPYAPRKSARISAQRNSNRTPSPQSSRRSGTPPRTTRKPAASTSTIMSPMPSPQKKRLPALDSSLGATGSGSLTAGSAAAAANSLGLDKPKQQQSKEESGAASSITHRAGMLPTPVKTPKKAPNEAQTASIQAVARNLFGHEEGAPASRKQRTPKKYSGMTMESFVAEEVEEPIQIFTDSRDRVPKVDASENNPFYGTSARVDPQPPRRRSKRKVAVPGEGVQDVDEALQRDDGIVYVFRGKKVFRKFARDDDEEDGEGHSLDGRLSVPLTRSSVKPRRLFQSQSEPQVTPEDEEALTDIEDQHLEQQPDKAQEDNPQTPAEDKATPATPSAPRFGPAQTPPDTRRTIRFGTKSEDASPSKAQIKQANVSDDGSRSKGRSASAERAAKRTGDEAAFANSAPKRTRA